LSVLRQAEQGQAQAYPQPTLPIQPQILQQPTLQPPPGAGAPVVAPELTQEQKEFLDAMNNLILSAQELAYAVALLPPELITKYPELAELVNSARNVVRAVWQFHKLVRRRVTG